MEIIFRMSPVLLSAVVRVTVLHDMIILVGNFGALCQLMACLVARYDAVAAGAGLEAMLFLGQF